MMLRNSIVSVAVLSLAAAVHADTLTVTSDADSGAGTLRQLMADSHDGDTIEIPADMKITLSSSLALPARSLAFVGGKGSSVSGGGLVPVFTYDRQWNDKGDHRFAFTGMTIEDGYTTSRLAGGIAISPKWGTDVYHTTLVLNDCHFLRNKNISGEHSGGALGGNSDWADIYATNCLFKGNCAQGSVIGTTYNTIIGRNVVFSHCTMKENGAGLTASDDTRLGGGLINGSARNLLLDDCTIVGNVSSKNNEPCILRTYSTDAVPDWQALSFRMTDCLVSNNLSKTTGLFIFSQGTNVVERTRLVDNTGFHMAIAQVDNSKVYFKDSIIDRNHCSATDNPKNYNRYGLFAYLGTTNAILGCALLSLENCTLRKNSFAPYYLTKSYYGGGDFFMKGCAVEENQTGGGGLINMLSKNSAQVIDCSFVNNATNGVSVGGDSGPALVLAKGSVVSNCTFFANDCRKFRGVLSGALVDTYHCTIVSNAQATDYGAFVYGGLSVSPIVENSVIADNSPLDIHVELNKPHDGFRGNALGIGNWVDPNLATFAGVNLVQQQCAGMGFAAAPAENDSKIRYLDGTSPKTLAFAKTSPLRDAAVAVVPGAATDGRGFKRDAKPDIGAYEFVKLSGIYVLIQ